MTTAAWICLALPLASTLLITLSGTRISRRGLRDLKAQEFGYDKLAADQVTGTSEFSINRKDFGVNWNGTLDQANDAAS